MARVLVPTGRFVLPIAWLLSQSRVLPKPIAFYLPEFDALRFFAFLMAFLGHGVVIWGLWVRETGWLL